MQGLQGTKVVLTGTRTIAELVALVEKLGGVAVLRPLQGSVKADPATLQGDVRRLIESRYDWIVLTTGTGALELRTAAEAIGLGEALVTALQCTHLAVRGYKTARVMKEMGVGIAVRDDDGTTASLLHDMRRLGLHGTRVQVQLHGEPAPALIDALEREGAVVDTVMPYEHVPTAEGVLDALIDEIVHGTVDAVTFTSSSQVRFLLDYALRMGKKQDVLAAMKDLPGHTHVVPVAVGRVTAGVLMQAGIPEVVWPPEERMGSMMIALARYFAGDEDNGGQP